MAVSIVAELRERRSDQNPLDFGLQRPSQIAPVRLQLTSKDGKSLMIGAIEPDDDAHASGARSAPAAAPRLSSIHETLKADHPKGGYSARSL